jgi:uncharacterized membrane protein YraQ (UPF0718 family)
MIAVIDSLAWGVVFRVLAAAAHAAPTVLCGLVVAAVLRRLLGPPLVRRMLAAGTTGSLIRAWLLGMLLPVCSIGAIPVARELRRAGLAGGTVLAFAVSAPLFNPISLLYGLTLSHPLVIVGFALASMLVVTIVGLAWDRLAATTAAPPVAALPVDMALPPGRDMAVPPGWDVAVPPGWDVAVPPGWRRSVALGLDVAREAAGPAAGYAAIALAGVGLLTCCLPNGALQRSMKAFDPWGPPLMAVVGVPAFLTPTDAMMQVGSMFDHGNSVGAAYVLLSVGAGLNLGLVAWAWRTWGRRAAAAWLAVFLGVVLALAAVIERPLSFRDSPPEDHTHAFDVFCQPFTFDEAAPAERVAGLLADRVPRHEWTALALLVGIGLFGAAVRRMDAAGRLESWLAAAPEPASAATRRGWDIVLPAPVIGAAALAGLVALSVAGAYLYYPPPQAALEDLVFVEAEAHGAALAGDQRRTRVWIEAWEDLVRRAEVGVWIRHGRPTPDLAAAAAELRERIETLEHAVLDVEVPDREQVAPALKAALAAARSYRDVLRRCTPDGDGR